MTIAQESFKAEVRNELDEFRAPLANQQRTPNVSPQVVSSTLGSVPLSLPQISSGSLPSTAVPPVTSTSTVDFQNQMLLMLTESFSKLSTAITDQKPDSKNEWHKLSGDPKKFRSWYLGIMENIALPQSELYDSRRNDVVITTTNTLLNGKLYSRVILALDGTAYQNFVTHKHLHANGVKLLQELIATYKPKNVPGIIVAKTVEFWGNTKHQATESNDSYYDRFQELLDDLADADEPISTRAAIR
jgi:hypothetical protein